MIRQLDFEDIEEWVGLITGIREGDKQWFQWQADALAGPILVPPESLAVRFQRALRQLARIGMSRQRGCDVARDFVHMHIARAFAVSEGVIDRRVEKDRLWDSD